MENATKREVAEGQGFEAIQNGLLQPTKLLDTPATVAGWVSPAKLDVEDPYGFLFYLEKSPHYNPELQGYPVTEYILRYSEKVGEVAKSNQIAYGLRFNQNYDAYKKTAEDHIIDPILGNPDNQEASLRNAFNVTGVGEEEMERSKLFEEEIEYQLAETRARYVAEIFTMSRLDPQSAAYIASKTNAEMLLTSLFNRAEEIADRLNGSQRFDFSAMRAQNTDLDATIARYAEKPAMVAEGGSCPSVKDSGDTKEFLSSGALYDALKVEGLPIEKKLISSEENEYHEDYIHAVDKGGCGNLIPGEKKGSDPSSWRKTCPSCGGAIIGCAPNQQAS